MLKKMWFLLMALLISMVAARCTGAAITPAVEKVVTEAAKEEVKTEAAQPEGATLVRFAFDALPVTWDLSLSTGSREYHVLRNVYDPLYDVDFATQELLPRGAVSHEVSEDGLVYTFHLNPDARWSDGKPVTAQDYAYGLMRLGDPQLAAAMSYGLDYIKGATDYYTGKGPASEVGVKALDDLTLEITLVKPAAFYIMATTSVWFSPLRQDVIEAHPDDWMLPPNVVGNGPYYITQYVPDQSMVIEKNPHYWRKHQGPDRVEISFFTDSAGAFRAYEAGEVDYAVVPTDSIERVKADAQMSQEFHLAPQMGVSWIVFDTTNADSPVSDKRVRQALSLVIDREGLVQAIFKGSRRPAYHLIPDNLWGYNPDAGVKGGLEEAKALLAEAGYPDGEGWPEGVSLHSNNILDDDFGKGVAEALAGMWKEQLGIDVQIEALEYQASEQWWQAQVDQHYHMFLLGWSADYADPSNFYYDSMGIFYPQYSHWENEKYIDLVTQAAVAPSREEREALYKEASLVVEDELPQAPYIYRANPVIYKTWMEGSWLDPTLAFAEFSNMIVTPH
jgi:oligopeptide transport system substrate-binding protein